MPKATFFNLPEGKRERVIAAAVQEFASGPYRSASLDRIAEAAGIAKGSLYQYFHGKAELYEWLVTGYLPEQKLAALEGAALPEGAGLFETLGAFFHAGLALFVAKPQLARLGATLMAPVVEHELAALSARNRELTHQYLKQLVEAAQHRGEVRRGVDADLAAVVVANIMGQGLTEALVRSLGVAESALIEDPELLQNIDRANLQLLVDEFITMLRGAIGSAGVEP